VSTRTGGPSAPDDLHQAHCDREIPQETEISDAETLRTKAALSCFPPGLETGARLRKAATPRHFRRQLGKSPFAGTAWWRRQLTATRLGKANSLFIRELTGNFSKMGPFG
jgi:hypothetical protein